MPVERFFRNEWWEAIKTYCTGAFAWFLLWFKAHAPQSYGEWGDFFNMLAAFFALVLVILRFRNDIFKKERKETPL